MWHVKHKVVATLFLWFETSPSNWYFVERRPNMQRSDGRQVPKVNSAVRFTGALTAAVQLPSRASSARNQGHLNPSATRRDMSSL